MTLSCGHDQPRHICAPLVSSHSASLSLGSGRHGLWDPKGITGSITLDGQNLTGHEAWGVQNLELQYSELSKLQYSPVAGLASNASLGPVFFRG